MPEKLTAENGAKALLMAEFEEDIERDCECGGGIDDCEVCGGTGQYVEQVPISWTNIKRIYEKAVANLGRRPEDVYLPTVKSWQDWAIDPSGRQIAGAILVELESLMKKERR